MLPAEQNKNMLPAVYIMEILITALIIGIIPAMIAKSKGRDFFLWYIYGVAMFILALPHALLIKDTSPTSKDITPETHMRCPDCKEFVRIGAKKCKHCGCEFAEQEPETLQPKTKQCPYCAETIKEEAIFCRFCQKSLVEDDPKEESKEQPKESQKDWAKQGAELLKAEDYKGAIATFTRAINESPSGELYFGRAVAYSKMQDKNKTIADLKTASNYGHEKAKETLANLHAGQ